MGQEGGRVRAAVIQKPWVSAGVHLTMCACLATMQNGVTCFGLRVSLAF